MLVWLTLSCAIAYASGEEVTFQSGRTLTTVDNSDKVFNSEYETSINKLYLAPWNDDNGATYFWGWQPTLAIAEENSDTKFRTLIRFDGLDEYIPSGEDTTVLEADMTLSFMNSGGDALLEACFVTLPWDYDYAEEGTK